MPSKATTGDVVHPEFGELRLVVPSALDVGDHQPATGMQHSHGFADGFLPASTSRDVVDCQAGEHQVETVVFKGQCRHVGGVQFDAIRDPLGDGIAPGGLGGIGGLIGVSPQVYADSPASSQMLSGGCLRNFVVPSAPVDGSS